MATRGQELILTENRRSAVLPPGSSLGNPPHTSPATSRSISHPGVFDEGSKVNSGQRVVRIQMRQWQERALFLPVRAAPQSFSFLFWIFFHSHWPLKRVLPQSWLHLASSCNTVSSIQCLLSTYCIPFVLGAGGRRRGQAVPRKPTGPPVFKESLKTGQAEHQLAICKLFTCTSRFSQRKPGSPVALTRTEDGYIQFICFKKKVLLNKREGRKRERETAKERGKKQRKSTQAPLPPKFPTLDAALKYSSRKVGCRESSTPA